MVTELNKKTKNLDMWDIAFVKIAVMFFVMFLFSAWVEFRNFVLSINSWILFLGWILFAIKPLFRFFQKRFK